MLKIVDLTQELRRITVVNVPTVADNDNDNDFFFIKKRYFTNHSEKINNKALI